jgi:hypothetical protein
LAETKSTAPAMTDEEYKQLVKPGVTNTLTFSSYPDDIWPKNNIGMGNMKAMQMR